MCQVSLSYVFTRRRIYVFTPIPGKGRLPHSRAMPPTAPLKLLVVDDHEAFRQTVRQMFDSKSVQITEAGSGEEAVKVFATADPDWVIMDLRMPGMGGIKATEAIRKLAPEARVIVISQFSDAEYREQAREAGAVEFVNKEDVSLLSKIIRAQLPGS